MGFARYARYAGCARRCAVAGCLAALALLSPVASAQQAPKGSEAPKAAAPAQPAQPQVAMPEAESLVLLVRTSLLTLNDAVQTGNFTVLRDIAAPAFRDANSAARLGAIFNGLSQNRVDLSAVAILAPQLREAPAIDPKTNMLRITGSFPGNPVRIDFELLFQPVAGRWRLFGLSVQPVAAAPVAAAPEAKAATPVAKKPDPPKK